MFTKNAISHAYCRTFGKISSAKAIFPITNLINEHWKDYSAITCKSIGELLERSNLLTSALGGTYAGGVLFGDGTAEPTMDDYKLSGSAVSGYSETHTFTVNHNTETGITSITKKYTITNTGSAAITISEIVLIDSFQNGGYHQPFIIDRTLLDSPVTIPAGGTGTVTYTINAICPVA